MFRKILKSLALQSPVIGQIVKERDRLRGEIAKVSGDLDRVSEALANVSEKLHRLNIEYTDENSTKNSGYCPSGMIAGKSFRDHIRSIAIGRRRILEIGPSYNPILPKRDGFPVETLDHAERTKIVEKYKAFGVDATHMEEVDHVTTDIGSLRNSAAPFDMIVASHVIEHSPSLIDFLNDCDSLLTSDGVLALLVPDKRNTFDIFRPLTSPGAAIDAQHEQRRLHIGALFDHHAYFALNSGQMAWAASGERSFSCPHTPSLSRSKLEEPLSGLYADAHAWVFVPSSFRFIVSQLRAAGFIRSGIVESHPTIGYEFFAMLSRQAPVDDTPTPEALASIQRELEAGC